MDCRADEQASGSRSGAKSLLEHPFRYPESPGAIPCGLLSLLCSRSPVQFNALTIGSDLIIAQAVAANAITAADPDGRVGRLGDLAAPLRPEDDPGAAC